MIAVQLSPPTGKMVKVSWPTEESTPSLTPLIPSSAGPGDFPHIITIGRVVIAQNI
jgi:hypothetical protein